jgi:hypothetical protein
MIDGRRKLGLNNFCLISRYSRDQNMPFATVYRGGDPGNLHWSFPLAENHLSPAATLTPRGIDAGEP